MSPSTQKVNAAAERIARIFGVPVEPLQNQIREETQGLRAKRRKAVRRDKPVLGLTAGDYDKLIGA